MLIVAAIQGSQSGDFVFTKRMTSEEYAETKPTKLAEEFYDRVRATPINILVFDGEEEVDRFYPGIDYPEGNSENPQGQRYNPK